MDCCLNILKAGVGKLGEADVSAQLWTALAALRRWLLTVALTALRCSSHAT